MFKKFCVISPKLIFFKDNILYNLVSFNLNYNLTMPKSKSNKSNSKGNKDPQTVEVISCPVYNNKSGNIEIKIVAKPGAKFSSITSVEEEGVGVQIGAPPVDGEANEELIKFISKTLDLKKSCVSLNKGSKSRQKILVLTDCSVTCDQVINKLKSEIGS